MQDQSYKAMNRVLSKQLARQAKKHEEDRECLARAYVDEHVKVLDLARQLEKSTDVLERVADHRNDLARQLADTRALLTGVESDLNDANERFHPCYLLGVELAGHLGKVRRELDTAQGAVRELTQERDAAHKALDHAREKAVEAGLQLAGEVEAAKHEVFKAQAGWKGANADLEELKQRHRGMCEERRRCYTREQRLKGTMGNAIKHLGEAIAIAPWDRSRGWVTTARDILDHVLCEEGHAAPLPESDLNDDLPAGSATTEAQHLVDNYLASSWGKGYRSLPRRELVRRIAEALTAGRRSS